MVRKRSAGDIAGAKNSCMSRISRRIAREKKTIRFMIGLYCRGHHGAKPGSCRECKTLLDYALARLERCPYQEDKPVCAYCPIHCYKPEMRERIRSVMRYSGPRLIFRHPVLALLHLVDVRIKAPVDSD